MRDRETIDSELRLLAAKRRSIRERGGQPSSRQVDDLLDERLGHRAEPPKPTRLKRARSRWWPTLGRGTTKPATSGVTGRKGAVRRFGLLAALPLSLVAVAAVLLVMFAVHDPHPVAQPAVVPPPSARPDPPAPKAAAPATPKAPAPPVDVDKTFIDVLRLEGVPVPDHEYVVNQARAVCDFLTHQSNFTDAVSFVQRTSLWDANQSSDFAADAIVSFCPQYKPSGPDETQQAVQNALSDLQGIDGDLQGIQGDLHGIQGNLPALPGDPPATPGDLSAIPGQ